MVSFRSSYTEERTECHNTLVMQSVAGSMPGKRHSSWVCVPPSPREGSVSKAVHSEVSSITHFSNTVFKYTLYLHPENRVQRVCHARGERTKLQLQVIFQSEWQWKLVRALKACCNAWSWVVEESRDVEVSSLLLLLILFCFCSFKFKVQACRRGPCPLRFVFVFIFLFLLFLFFVCFVFVVVVVFVVCVCMLTLCWELSVQRSPIHWRRCLQPLIAQLTSFRRKSTVRCSLQVR